MGDVNVGGNLNIVDESRNRYKVLYQCSNEELLTERPFRIENIRRERARKLNRLLAVASVLVPALLGAIAWAYWQGKPDLVSVVVGAGSLGLGYASLRAAIEPTEFEKRELSAVAEINMLLRSRRVE